MTTGKSRRAEQLARDFAAGQLPEQDGKSPAHVWCDECKGRGWVHHREPGEKLWTPEACGACGERGVLERAPDA